MPWTKGKIEKAWRVFDKSMGVIADALEVDVLELKALILEGTVPPYDRDEPAANMEAAGDTMEADSHGSDPVWLDETPPAPTPEAIEVLTKRATLADLAPAPPSQILGAADPIIEKPLQFRPEPKRPAYVAPVSQPAPNAVQAVDVLIGESLEDRPMPRRRSNLASSAEDKRRASKPAEFHLMHKGKYLHESCTGLTEDKARAWRQPESKLAAVRRKFPETVDYIEVIA